MTGTSHLPFAVDPLRARQELAQLDWPGAVAASVDALPVRLRWLPFHPVTGTNLLDKHRYAKLSRTVIPPELLSTGSASPGPPDGKSLPPGSLDGEALFIPCYLFQGPSDAGSWAVIEGVGGSAVGGRLAADRATTAIRLGLLVLLALFTFFLATAYANIILATVFSMAGPLLILAGGFMRFGVAALLLALLYMLLRWMMEQRDRLLAGLNEPIQRLETGQVRLPLDRNWLKVIKGAGKVGLILVPLIVFSLLLQLAAGPALGMTTILLRVVQLAAALAFGTAAMRLSRGEWLPSPASAGSADAPVRPSGAAADMVKVLLHVSMLAMFGLIVGYVLDLWGMGDLLRRRFHMDPGLLAGIGARAGAIIGVIASGSSRQDRITLAVGLSAELICDLLLGPWVGIPVLLILVAAASWINIGSGPRGRRSATPFWDAFRTAWIFVFWATIGGIAGSIVGLVFMGPAGRVVGEMLGGSVLATAALLIWRPSDGMFFTERRQDSP